MIKLYIINRKYYNNIRIGKKYQLNIIDGNKINNCKELN